MTSLSLRDSLYKTLFSVLCYHMKPFPQYYDCDTEFRLAWVQQKFIENQVNLQFKAPTVAFSL